MHCLIVVSIRCALRIGVPGVTANSSLGLDAKQFRGSLSMLRMASCWRGWTGPTCRGDMVQSQVTAGTFAIMQMYICTTMAACAKRTRGARRRWYLRLGSTIPAALLAFHKDCGRLTIRHGRGHGALILPASLAVSAPKATSTVTPLAWVRVAQSLGFMALRCRHASACAPWPWLSNCTSNSAGRSTVTAWYWRARHRQTQAGCCSDGQRPGCHERGLGQPTGRPRARKKQFASQNKKNPGHFLCRKWFSFTYETMHFGAN